MPNNDYILRSDVVFAFCGACEGTEICGQMGEPCDEVKRIMAIPAADVVEAVDRRPQKEDVIHCVECLHLGFKDFSGVCKIDGLAGIVRPEDYCSRGVKRNE